MPPSSERKEAFTNHPSVERIASSEVGDEELSRHRTYCPLCREIWFRYLDEVWAKARARTEDQLREYFRSLRSPGDDACEHFGEVDIFKENETDLEILQLRRECPCCREMYEVFLRRTKQQ